MKSIISKSIITIVFLVINYVGYAQLTDYFGKILVHEIKMKKLDNGTYIGAVEWTTGGIDSLQRYIVNELDINAPVMVRVISKAPKHNIDLSFHKKGWDKVESKISTEGDKFADKIFRTMGTTGIGVSSKVAGIPYLIIVKVGLQFPSTNSLIRITDDKEEYVNHLRKLGIKSEVFKENNALISNNSSPANTGSGDNDSLMYIIIGLLGVIALLLIIFLVKRKISKTATLLVLCLGFFHLAISQNSVPRNIPAAKQPTVFFEYSSQNLANQAPVRDERVVYINREDPKDGTITNAPVRIRSNPGSIELRGEAAEDVRRRMRKATDEFDKTYGDDMPGEETEGDQRVLPRDQNGEEITRLRRQVRQLRADVDRLEREDEEFEPEEDQDAKVLIYCELLEDCKACMDRGLGNFVKRYTYYHFLQTYYLKRMTEFQDAVAHGDAVASIPGAGLGWAKIRNRKVMPSIDKFRKSYHKKFDEYIESMKSDLDIIRECYSEEKINSVGVYETQVLGMIRALEISRINL